MNPNSTPPDWLSVCNAKPGGEMIRLGLCCKFAAEPIRFRDTTARAMLRLERPAALEHIAALCRENAGALHRALEYCVGNGIGCFRVNSRILPLRTHPVAGYRVRDLPDARRIVKAFCACGEFARAHNLRLTFHPDQFILLSALRPEITRASIAELEYQTEVAEWVGADVINIHAGGAYGDKPAALKRLARSLKRLSDHVRCRLTLENDEHSYTPRDLLPFCAAQQIPFVYDVHHHRCLPDGQSQERVTGQALATWNREPLFHVSSPKNGPGGRQAGPHHDYINPRDFPRAWLKLDVDITVEVEAKAKELAVKRLARHLRRKSF